MLKRRITKYFILFSFIICLIFLTGCNNTNGNILITLENNIDKIEQTLEKVQTIDVSELIIDDFMDESELFEINTQESMFNSNNDVLDNYVNKIAILNNNVCSTVKINNEILETKDKILQKCNRIKFVLKRCDGSVLRDNEKIALKDIIKTLMNNNTQISLTRNEINNYLLSVKKLKLDYNKKTDQLNTRYIKLQGALNTRNSHYNNILFGMEQIYYILSDECNDDYVNEYSNETRETGINKKNIDTYENAGNNMFGLPNNQKNGYPYSNYGYNGYGYGVNNGYGFGGYGNNMYGYGMNIPPYSFGWGYRMPNINSYGSYKNIDTYRNYRNNKRLNEENIQEEIIKKENANKKDNIQNDLMIENFQTNKKLKPTPLER